MFVSGLADAASVFLINIIKIYKQLFVEAFKNKLI